MRLLPRLIMQEERITARILHADNIACSGHNLRIDQPRSNRLANQALGGTKGIGIQ